MDPIFKEKEFNGIYTATLNGLNEIGQEIECKLEMDLKSIQGSEIERCLLLGFDMNTISVRVENLLAERKKYGIAGLYYDFNKRINFKTT